MPSCGLIRKKTQSRSLLSFSGASSNPTSTNGERDFQLAGLVSVAYRTRAIGLYSFILPLANFNVAIADDQSISRVGDPRREPMPQFQDSR